MEYCENTQKHNKWFINIERNQKQFEITVKLPFANFAKYRIDDFRFAFDFFLVFSSQFTKENKFYVAFDIEFWEKK